MSRRGRNANVVYDNEFVDRYIRQLAQAGYAAPTKDEAASQVKAMFQTVANCLGHGLSVSRQGFGRFELRYRRSRNGRNPQTGDKIHLPAMVSVGFKPGVRLRKSVNQTENNMIVNSAKSNSNRRREGDK